MEVRWNKFNQINQLVCLENQMSGTNVVCECFPIELFKKKKIFDPQLGATRT